MNTEVLSKSLNEFASEIKIKKTQYDQLKNRRNSVLDLLREYSKLQNLKIAEEFNVGSYKIKTGVKRKGKNGWAFDIDYVVAYDNEFDYNEFKNRLTNWLRNKLKEKYKYNVIISNRKKVLTIAFRDKENTKTMFYLDLALYIKENDEYFHILRNENGDYKLEQGEPKLTYQRQKDELAYKDQKRNAIIILKYLKEKNRIIGVSSIFITEAVIDQSSLLDTFSLIKGFIEGNIVTTQYNLTELPYSDLIKDPDKFNASLKEMKEKFFKNDTTQEIYDAMNSWFDYALPNLDKELMEERNERYSGG